MIDDHRIKRVLKRYPKGEQFDDGTIDVTSLGLELLLQVCGGSDAAFLARPRELGDDGLAYLSRVLGVTFDRQQFDYFLHSYVRSEFVSTYYDDPSITSTPAPEDGPPAKIPTPSGQRWRSARPKDDKESYVPWEVIEGGEER